MAEGTRRFRCPCCHKQLEIEMATGEVHEVDRAKAGAEQNDAEMDRMVEKHKKESERLDDVFSRAAEDAMTQKDKFDDLFNSALEDAKKDEDEKPPSPFDLD